MWQWRSVCYKSSIEFKAVRDALGEAVRESETVFEILLLLDGVLKNIRESMCG